MLKKCLVMCWQTDVLNMQVVIFGYWNCSTEFAYHLFWCHVGLCLWWILFILWILHLHISSFLPFNFFVLIDLDSLNILFHCQFNITQSNSCYTLHHYACPSQTHSCKYWTLYLSITGTYVTCFYIVIFLLLHCLDLDVALLFSLCLLLASHFIDV
jgi:hypothetical protein